MERGLISAKNVVAKVYQDFDIAGETNVGKMINWIGTGFQLLEVNPGFLKVTETVPINEGRVLIPKNCGITSVTYNGVVLDISKRSNYSSLTLKYPNSVIAVFNGPYLDISVETGNVTFHYYTIGVDCDGYPMIPNSELLTEALAWFVMSKLLLGGYKHPVVTYETAYSMWTKLKPQAANDVNFPTLFDMDRFAMGWRSLVTTLNDFKSGFVSNDFSHEVTVLTGSEDNEILGI